MVMGLLLDVSKVPFNFEGSGEVAFLFCTEPKSIVLPKQLAKAICKDLSKLSIHNSMTVKFATFRLCRSHCENQILMGFKYLGAGNLF